MTDRELLEMAAKAAGIDCDAQIDNGTVVTAGEAPSFWNPLADDGDALRLAVKLGFINPGQWPCAGYQEADRMLQETGEVDWFSATRRAIVRAAAQIGKAMP